MTSSSDPRTGELPAPDTGLAGDLWLASDAWMKRWQEDGTNLPNLLYHYTDAPGLLGIVSSGALFATHARFVNDSGEIRYVEFILNTVIDALRNEFDDLAVQEYLALVPELFRELVAESFELYLVCFCEYGDQLSQWRGYAAAGEGYAVGFRSDSLSAGRLVRKIIYDQDEQRRVMRGILEPHCELLREAITQDEPEADYLVKAIRTGAGSTLGPLGECSWAFKHPGFREESEIRLIQASPIDRSSQFHQTPDLRVRGSQLVPYTRIALASPRDQESNGAIAEVVIGPNAHPELAAHSVAQLLESAGYRDAPNMVRISGIPLRT